MPRFLRLFFMLGAVAMGGALIAWFGVPWEWFNEQVEAQGDPTLWIDDSFEGTPPTGWDAGWNVVEFGNSTQDTTSEGGTPPGGGTYAYRQMWDKSSGRPGWLRFYFPPGTTDEGDVIEFEYYIMYDANFDHNGTYVKQIIMRSGIDQYFYLDTFDPWGNMFVLFQLSNNHAEYHANINGGEYQIPLGEWVHFKWQIKISTETNGNPRNGYLYGWVDGVQRWEHEGINTIYSGQYNELNLNTTFNNPVLYGPNQKRYWDLFKVRDLDSQSSQPPSADTTPPGISNVTVGPSFSVATITWSTTEAADAKVEYGLTADYGNLTNVDSMLATNHSQVLTSLAPETPYHYRVISTDASGNTTVSDDFTFTTVAVPPFPTGAIAHWELNGSADDSSGNGHNGTVNGATFAAGHDGEALALDGTNDTVSVNPAPFNFPATAGFTIAAWVKNDRGSGAETDDIISWWDWSGNSRSFVLTHHNNDQYFFGIEGKGNITGGAVSTTWTHVTATYDGNSMKLYVNGTEVASQSATGALPNSTAQLIIGGQQDGTNYFDGLIDEVYVYDRALEADEISTLLEDQAPAPSLSPAPNEAPVITVSGPQSVNIGQELTFTVTAADTDSDEVSLILPGVDKLGLVGVVFE